MSSWPVPKWPTKDIIFSSTRHKAAKIYCYIKMHNATKIQPPLVCHHSPLTRWPGLSHAAHKLRIPDVLKNKQKRRGFDWIVSGYSLIFVTLNIFFCQFFGKTLKIWRIEFHLPCFPLECKWIWRPDVMGWIIWPTILLSRNIFGQKHERFWSSFSCCLEMILFGRGCYGLDNQTNKTLRIWGEKHRS